jgi:hypothetical protein
MVDAYLSGLPDQPTAPDGKPSSASRPTLNPLFVEWLMGWPIGHTDIASTDSDSAAMEWSRWLLRWRSAFSRIASASGLTS